VCKFFKERTPEELKIKEKAMKRKLYASHAWLRELTSEHDSGDRRQRFMEEPTEVFGHPLRVVELKGEPGEAYITNMSTLHSRSFNVLDRPRFMTVQPIGQSDLVPDPG
jgi:hypothetical protein